MKKLIEQISKFGVVGVIAFVVDYVVLYCCTEFLHIYYLISSVISFVISVIVNYVLSVKWVFNVNNNKSKKYNFILFIILSVIGLFINEAIMYVMSSILCIYYMISKLFSTFIVMIFNFITRKIFLEDNKYILKKRKSIFCYSLVFISLILCLFILVIKPKKVETVQSFESKNDYELTKISFPFEQKIKINDNNLYFIDFYLHDLSINNYNYHLELLDDNNKLYYEHDYVNYDSDIIRISFAPLINSKDLNLKLRLTCDDCNDVYFATSKVSDNDTYIVNDEDRTMNVYLSYYLDNRSYYWYVLLMLAVSFTLLPIALEEEKHEK